MNLGSRLSRSAAAAGAAVDRSAGTTILYPNAYEAWVRGAQVLDCARSALRGIVVYQELSIPLVVSFHLSKVPFRRRRIKRT